MLAGCTSTSPHESKATAVSATALPAKDSGVFRINASSSSALVEGATWGCRIAVCRPQPAFAELFDGRRLLARTPLYAVDALRGPGTAYEILFRFLVSGVPTPSDHFGPPAGMRLRVLLSDGQHWTLVVASGDRLTIPVVPIWD